MYKIYVYAVHWAEISTVSLQKSGGRRQHYCRKQAQEFFSPVSAIPLSYFPSYMQLSKTYCLVLPL